MFQLDSVSLFLNAIGNIPFGSVLLKVTLVLGLATVACALLHRHSAAIRHRIWVLALGVTLALPLALLLPQFEVRVLPSDVDSTRQERTEAQQVAQAKVPIAPAEKTLPESKADFSRQESSLQVGMKTQSTRANSATKSQQDSTVETSSARSAKSLGIGNLLVFIWLLGTVVASLLFVISLAIQTIQLSRLRRVNDDEWADSMNDAARRLGLQRPIITLESDQACVPAVVGILSPRLVVPHDWRTWSLAQRNCILLHELAHVKRFDVSTQFIGRLALLAYWFHPLVWFAVRQLRAERELASDDCVLLAGPAASDYAEELLRTLRCYRPVRPALGVAMAHSARLDQRVLAILDARRCRNPLGKTTAILLLCLFGLLGGVFGGVTLASRMVEKTTKDRFQFHPEPVPATDLKIGITAGKTVAVVVGPEKQKLGLKLEVTIKNDSKSAIKTLLPREWHGGKWPPSALYAAVAPAGAKELAAYHPVYRFGESSAESRNVTIEAGGTHKIEIRTDWPGTDTPAIPLIDKPGKYSAKFALVFEADGKQQVVESDVVMIEYAARPAAEKEPFTAWGKEVGGLQAGLRITGGHGQRLKQGEQVQFDIVVRNTTDRDISFTDHAGKRTSVGKPSATNQVELGWMTHYTGDGPLEFPGLVGAGREISVGSAGIYHLSDGQKKTSDSLSAGKYQIVSNNVLMYTRNANKNPELTTGIIEIELVDPASKKDDEKRPLTAKELTGKWFGEAENKDGIRKLEATLDFDILVPRGPEVRCSLRYSTPVSTSAAAQKGMDLAMIDDGTTGRVNLWLRFTKLGSTAVNKAELGHLARGENGTLLLTVLPEIEKGNMKDELLYRRFQGLVLRRVEDEKKPLTAKELTGKWYGEAENKDGIRKLTATFDFDIKFGGDVKWRLRYETEESNGAEIPITGHRVENSATGRVDLHFKKTVLGHLARGEGDTILLTILPEFETKNMPGERRYRRFEGLVLRREQGEKKPLTAKELTGKWFGEAENKDGIKKISANVNFDIKYGGDVHWDLRYESESRVSTPGIDGHRVENAATGRVDLHFRKTVFGHLERGEGDTILLTMLPEFENLYRRDGDELFYRRFEGLVLRRQEEPKEQAKPSDRPGDSAR